MGNFRKYTYIHILCQLRNKFRHESDWQGKKNGEAFSGYTIRTNSHNLILL